MKRWSDNGKIESPKIDAFLGMAISHEDGHGSLEVVAIEDGDLEWPMSAVDRTARAGAK